VRIKIDALATKFDQSARHCQSLYFIDDVGRKIEIPMLNITNLKIWIY